MKRTSIRLSSLAVGVVLLWLILPSAVRSQEVGPCNPAWYQAVPPNPDWGLPPTLGDMMPFHMYDTEEVEAVFLVPLAGLQTLLPQGVRALEANSELGPWSYLGHWASAFGVLVVTFQEDNRNMFGGAFNEVFMTVMIDDPSWSLGRGAWYPVVYVTTSEAAQWFGTAAFGLSKILGETHFQRADSKGMKGFVSADGELIMRMDVDTTGMAPAPVPQIMFVHTKEGYLVRSPIHATAEGRYASWTFGASTLKLGPHPIAQQLRAIGLGMYPSFGQTRGTHMHVTIERGTCEPLP